MPNIGRWLPVCVGVGVALTVLLGAYPTTDDFDGQNPFWNGLSSMVAEFAMQEVTAGALPRDGANVWLLLIPGVPLTGPEIQRVADFVSRDGGTLVLADDFGYGNAVARSLGLRDVFSQQPVIDPLIHGANANLPQVTFQRPGSDISIVTNQPSSLQNLSSEDVQASSSRFSFLDTNANGLWETQEPSGPLPIFAVIPLGAGSVNIISDASVFINGMFTKNRPFAGMLFSGRTALLFQSENTHSRLGEIKNVISFANEQLKTPVLLTLGIALAIAVPFWKIRRAEERS